MQRNTNKIPYKPGLATATEEQEEALFKAVSLSSPVGIYIVQDNRFHYVNSRFREDIGYSEDELMDMNPLSVVLPEDRTTVRKNAIQMLKGQRSQPYEYRVAAKTGEVRWILETVTSIYYQGKQATLGNFMDITERKQAEEIFQTVSLKSPTSIYIMQDGKFVFANPRLLSRLGYKEDEMLDTGEHSLIHPEDREMVRQCAIDMLKGIRTAPYEYRAITNDGEMIWVAETVASIQYQGKRAIMGTLLDITERKRAEELFRTVTLNAPCGIYVAVDSRFVFVNPRFLEDMGYSREELLYTETLNLVHPDDRGMVRKNAIDMLKGTRSTSYEFRCISKSGEVKWFVETAIPIQYQGKRAALGNILDITERKKMEEELAKYRIRLEDMIEDRTAKLEEAERMANTDALTGLFNRRYFQQRLKEEIARCSRFGDIFSLVFLDVDLFKQYNDTYGHLAGDEILKLLGQVIVRSIRTIDIGFRYGGDEFAILLPGTPLNGATRVAERIRQGVQTATGNIGVAQTCSLGIASWPTDGLTGEEITRAADAALYDAKQSGRNRVCLACEVLSSEELRKAKTDELQDDSAILKRICNLAASVDARDDHSRDHSRKVSQHATSIATALGYSKDRIERIRTAALLHDIGKVSIPDHLLTKSEPLVAEDWELIHAHPNLGVAILQHVDSLKDCLAAVQYHHERYDGTGYPAGLKGDNIPLDARILAVADSYDAMTSPRPYRSALSAEEAIEEIRRGAGTQFDSKVVNAFLSTVHIDRSPPDQTSNTGMVV